MRPWSRTRSISSGSNQAAASPAVRRPAETRRFSNHTMRRFSGTSKSRRGVPQTNTSFTPTPEAHAVIVSLHWMGPRTWPTHRSVFTVVRCDRLRISSGVRASRRAAGRDRAVAMYMTSSMSCMGTPQKIGMRARWPMSGSKPFQRITVG